MNAPRRRRQVSAACVRCRKRKLGCDQARPCVHCTRAGVECVPRQGDAQEHRPLATSSTQPASSRNVDEADNAPADTTVVLPETSIVDLSTMIFARMQQDRHVGHDSSALPGGHKTVHAQLLRGRHWRQIVEWELPPDDVLETFVDRFFVSVFHEQSFRQSYVRLIASQQVSYHEENFLWLSMLVLGLGAHYSSVSPSASTAGLDLEQLSRTLLASIELRFLQIIGCSTLEAVQICILLGSFHLFNGRPNAGLGILGSSVKIAQVIGLHREIMGPFLGRRLQTKRLENVTSIHGQLIQWREKLPDRLRIESYATASREISLLQMQALSLQLTYDNLQIILHRSAAFRVADGGASRVDATSISSPFSHRQLFEAAIRTADLHRYSHVLQECRRTHANMHIGITLFTAGVVLCAICLSQPMSEVSQRAKTGIMHIIRICHDNSSAQHLVSDQCVKILEGLVAVILQAENQLITGRPSAPPADELASRAEGSGAGERSRPVSDGRDTTGQSIVVGGRGAAGVLDPLQEGVFERHVQRPAPPGDAQGDPQPGDDSMGPHQTRGAESAAAPVADPVAGFDWDGDLSLLVDSGLGDASQLWLWADNLNYDSFAEFNDTGG
ncbi:Aspyridones cluster regulator apdR [Metarhizium anisopliae]